MDRSALAGFAGITGPGGGGLAGVAKEADTASTSLTGMVTPMAALVGAGVALSPVLITAATGLGGLGLAAYGAIAPLIKAAQSSKGLAGSLAGLDPEQQAAAGSLLALQKAYDRFQNALAPTVLSDFTDAVTIAGHVLKDLQPVSEAAGKALGDVLGKVDTELQSANWQNFFAFMGRTAGPDIELLTTDLGRLANALPSILEALQPVAVGMLSTIGRVELLTGDIARLTSSILTLNHTAPAPGSSRSNPLWWLSNAGITQSVKYINDLLPRALQHAAEGAGLVSKAGDSAARSTSAAGDAAQRALPAISGYGMATATAGSQTATFAQANQNLATSLTALIGPLLTLQGDTVSYEQAQQSAQQAIDKVKGSIDGQSASALAAQQAIIATTTAVQKYATDQITLHGNLGAASGAIQDQIRWLETHAAKSKIARQEIAALVLEEKKIKASINQGIKVSGSGTWELSGAPGHPQFHHRPTGHAYGGFVSGPGGPEDDQVPAYLSSGEYVVRAAAVDRYGQSFLDALNSMRFASGGIVPSYSGNVPGLAKWVGQDYNATVNSIISSIGGAMASAMTAAVGSASGGGYNAAYATEYAYAKSLFPSHGWGASQWPPLFALWQRESGWNPAAQNKSSGAAGIPQDITGNFHGGYRGQIGWGENYIAGRYGSPAGAWAHEQSAGWYARGGRAGRPSAASRAAAARTEASAGSSLMNFFLNPTSLAEIWKQQTKFLEDIATYYKGPARKWRDAMIMHQTDHLGHIEKDISKVSNRLSAAISYQQSVKSGLASYADLSGLDAFGNLMAPGMRPGQSAGQGLESQLKLKLSNLRKWQADIGALRRAKVSAALIRQVVAMGPDTGMPYAEAILAGGHSLIHELNATEAQVKSVEGSTARLAERSVFGASVSQLREDRRDLKEIGREIGREIAKEAAKWFGVPRKDQPPVVINFSGAHPTAEERHTLMRDLALVLGG